MHNGGGPNTHTHAQKTTTVIHILFAENATFNLLNITLAAITGRERRTLFDAFDARVFAEHNLYGNFGLFDGRRARAKRPASQSIGTYEQTNERRRRRRRTQDPYHNYILCARVRL